MSSVRLRRAASDVWVETLRTRVRHPEACVTHRELRDDLALIADAMEDRRAERSR